MKTEKHQSASLPSLSFVGAGNVATHLALACSRVGYRVAGIYSRTAKSADVLCQRLVLLGQNSATTTNLAELKPADIYVISVRDDALPAIADAWPVALRNGIVVHTAGCVDMNVLSSVSEHYGVVYPLQTFSKEKNIDLQQTTCFVEASDAETLSALTTLGSTVFGRCEEATSDARQQLHLAAVFACNFTNHMYALAYELLTQHEIDPVCLHPLIKETATKVLSMQPHDCQTGPARRFDTSVIERHRQLLNESEELSTIYTILTESIKKRYL